MLSGILVSPGFLCHEYFAHRTLWSPMHDFFCEVVVGQLWHIWWLANHRLCHGWPTIGWPTSNYAMVGQPVVGQLLVGRPGWDTQSTYMDVTGSLSCIFIARLNQAGGGKPNLVDFNPYTYWTQKILKLY